MTAPGTADERAELGPDDPGDPPGSAYDEMAEGYLRHWAPVLHDAAVRVLDEVAPALDRSRAAGGDSRLLDVGSGTGTLAIAALRRWPDVRVIGLDASSGMLELARRAVADAPQPHAGHRFETVVASAEALPPSIGRFDAAVSSFMLQLVSNRAAALREVRGALRPRAPFAWVAWRRSDEPYEPDRIANAVLDEFGFDPPESDTGSGDFTSAASAGASMRRAGFRRVRSWEANLAYAWAARDYLAFLTEFDEAALFDDLDAPERREIEARILERLLALAPEQLVLRLPLVYAVGLAPD